MARQIHKLSARAVATLKKPGRHGDGGGLYLSISDNGGRRWVFLYRRAEKLREMGLGSARDVSLVDAREAASEVRKTLAAGLDPLARRHADAGASMTFAECGAKYIEANKSGWRNPVHLRQWQTTLASYVYPTIGRLSVADVGINHIIGILEPIWNTRTETAARVRGRIETVLDWAKARGLREGENPARWRGNLNMLLPRRSRVQRTKHHAALPHTEVGKFLEEMSARDGSAALALKFAILTATRSGEVLGAQLAEIDRRTATWTIPSERMKAFREHRVPLSRQALAVLDQAADIATALRTPPANLFVNEDSGHALSGQAMRAVLKRMKRGDITVHGFRSTFRDWSAETTNFPNEVCEAALAHRIEDKAEASYRRGDLFQKRAKLMQAWADYCDRVGNKSGSVVPIRNEVNYRSTRLG